MNYQFFIQGADSGEANQEFRFIMVLDTNDRESLAQSAIQAMITRHQMHTCVNIPFRYRDGYTMRFKTSFADMDGEPHPVLVILTNKYGAFRLPFPPGEEGYRLFQKTYKEVKLRLIAHRNRHLKRLSSEPVHSRRLEAPKPKSPPRGTENVRTAKQTPATKPRKPVNTAGNPAAKSTNAPKPKAAPTRNWWRRQPESLRWLAGGLAVGVVVVSVLFTGKAFAAEQPVVPGTVSLEKELLDGGTRFETVSTPAVCAISNAADNGEPYATNACSTEGFSGTVTIADALPELRLMNRDDSDNDVPSLEDELLALGANVEEINTRYAGFPVPEVVDAPKAQIVESCSIPQATDAGGAEFSSPALNEANREI